SKEHAWCAKPVADDVYAHFDEMYFDHLFKNVAMVDDDARLAFDKQLAELAWNELQRAIRKSGSPDARKLKAISDAERMFLLCLKKNFPDAAAVQAASTGIPA